MRHADHGDKVLRRAAALARVELIVEQHLVKQKARGVVRPGDTADGTGWRRAQLGVRDEMSLLAAALVVELDPRRRPLATALFLLLFFMTAPVRARWLLGLVRRLGACAHQRPPARSDEGPRSAPFAPLVAPSRAATAAPVSAKRPLGARPNI